MYIAALPRLDAGELLAGAAVATVPYMAKRDRARTLRGWQRQAQPKQRAVKADAKDLAAIGIAVTQETSDG